jgi:hypothetical protein
VTRAVVLWCICRAAAQQAPYNREPAQRSRCGCVTITGLWGVSEGIWQSMGVLRARMVCQSGGQHLRRTKSPLLLPCCSELLWGPYEG